MFFFYETNRIRKAPLSKMVGRGFVTQFQVGLFHRMFTPGHINQFIYKLSYIQL